MCVYSRPIGVPTYRIQPTGSPTFS
jgi:hypothetical protein